MLCSMPTIVEREDQGFLIPKILKRRSRADEISGMAAHAHVTHSRPSARSYGVWLGPSLVQMGMAEIGGVGVGFKERGGRGSKRMGASALSSLIGTWKCHLVAEHQSTFLGQSTSRIR